MWGTVKSERWPGRPARRGRRAAGAGVFLSLAMLLAGAALQAPAAMALRRSRGVIVRALPGRVLAAEREVSSAGGRVEMRLPIIDGFSATVTESARQALAMDPGVVSVTSNGPVSLSSSSYDPSTDPYSLHNVETAIRATNMWAAGYTGAGVDVALIDSGVAPVQGLSTPGKIVNGPDLSFD